MPHHILVITIYAKNYQKVMEMSKTDEQYGWLKAKTGNSISTPSQLHLSLYVTHVLETLSICILISGNEHWCFLLIRLCIYRTESSAWFKRMPYRWCWIHDNVVTTSLYITVREWHILSDIYFLETWRYKIVIIHGTYWTETGITAVVNELMCCLQKKQLRCKIYRNKRNLIIWTN